MSLARYEGVQDDVELIPHAFDGTLAAPRTDRHLKWKKLPSRSAGSRCTGCGVRNARRDTHDRRYFPPGFRDRQLPNNCRDLGGTDGPHWRTPEAFDDGEAWSLGRLPSPTKAVSPAYKRAGPL